MANSSNIHLNKIEPKDNYAVDPRSDFDDIVLGDFVLKISTYGGLRPLASQ